MAFTSLLTAVYPVGSLYLSTSSVSPATIIGGTWTQIKGAVLGFTGSNSFGGAASFAGSLKISTNQLPSHAHSVSDDGYSMLTTARWSTDEVGRRTTGSGTSNYALTSTDMEMMQETTRTAYQGGGQDFLPYHFAVYGWYRTA